MDLILDTVLQDIEIGGKYDLDTIHRLRGFGSGDELASITFSDGVSYSVISLGEQRIYGVHELEGDELGKNDVEHYLQYKEEIHDSDCVIMGSWLSIDCTTDNTLSFRISDELVIDTLSIAREILLCLEEHLKKGGSHKEFWEV
jgi:hypothetical protein